MKYRHEYKYYCTAREAAELQARARGLMRPDPHAGADGSYRVRSLYFDTLEDACYFETEDGVDVRDKYRIRIYNGNAERISLERKSKKSGMTLKSACRIDEALCRRMMAGQGLFAADVQVERARAEGIPTEGLLLGKASGRAVTEAGRRQELIRSMRERCMRPAVIVEYLRYPFVEPNGNVRITFDMQITSSCDFNAFLDRRIGGRPILPNGGGILEVKWDSLVPEYLKQGLQMNSLQRISFSKYCLCRKYNVYGGIRL